MNKNPASTHNPLRAKRPTFVWQGLFIILPVIALSAIALISLRQDKLAVEQEAREQAQIIAEDLAGRLQERLISADTLAEGMASIQGESRTLLAFQIDEDGRLLSPQSYAPAVVPNPFDGGVLNDEQTRQWQLVRSASFAEQGLREASEACAHFVASSPPASFAATALYSLALLTSKKGEQQAAAQIFQNLVEEYPDVTLESGLPLQPLAQIKLIELSIAHSNYASEVRLRLQEAFCSNVVFHPTALTPYLLKTMTDLEQSSGLTHGTAEKWLRTWHNHETARGLYRVLAKAWFGIRDSPASERNDSDHGIDEANAQRQAKTRPSNRAQRHSWIEVEGENWLAACFDSEPARDTIVCLSEREVRKRVDETQAESNRLPPYFGVAVEVAGRPVQTVTNAAGVLAISDSSTNLRNLAPSAEREPETQATPLGRYRVGDLSNVVKVSVHLADATLLYARQRQRTLWFGSLMLVSALAVMIAFASARRAFHRPLRLNELKSNFVSSVSHELRAPIASVRLMAEGLESGRIRDEQKKHDYFKFMVQECRRLTALIENVLDFSRIEQGRKEYEFEPTDLVNLTRETVKVMETQATEHGVTLALAIDDSRTSSLSSQPILDGRAIQQALVNLIDNAIKHSPAGATVTIGLDFPAATTRSPDDNEQSRITHHASRISLWVEDRGPGIAREEHERIFERFYRVGSELRRKTQGVGVGLSIVKHVVDAHGGKVIVRSAPGEGSRFTIELPNGTVHSS